MRAMKSDFILGMIVGAGLLGGGLLLGGADERPAPPPPQELVQARRFEVVDEAGTVVLALGSNKDGGSMSVRDRFGKSVLLASAAEQGGTLVVNNAGGAQPAFMAGASPAGGHASLFDARGKSVLDMAAQNLGASMQFNNASGQPALNLQSGGDPPNGGTIWAFAQSGTRALRLFSNVAGEGVIETYRGGGDPLVSLSSTEGGHGQISTFAGLNKPLIMLTASANHEGQLYTYDAAGKPMVALASRPGAAEGSPSGGPTLRVFNTQGQAVVTLESNEENDGEIGVWRHDGTGKTLSP